MLTTAIRGLVRVVLAGTVLYVAAFEGRRAGLIAFAVWLALLFVMVVWLPRAAHRAFRQGNYKRSKLLYNVLRVWALRKTARVSIEVSLAACALADGSWDRAIEMLDGMEVEALNEAARAAWLNNRAYALARSGRDAGAALEYSNRAIDLRPDVAGFRHTRGVALLALGRVEEAIGELDRLWGQLAGHTGDEMPLLEAERCYDLGRAWQQKGERDYALDYFDRARRASPESRWAYRAAEYLDPVTRPQLAEFLES
ncbi:MAG: hypothetical protein MJE77_21325 [Proteobacteria bacterium]|nr:hypothetical protein [Pseudomonadota bacterium]